MAQRSDRSDQLADDLVARGDVGEGRRDTGATHQIVDVTLLLGHHQSDDGALGTGAGRAPGAVKEGLVFGRRVDVHHQVHVVDVDAAGRDVGGHHHLHLSRHERLEVLGTDVLRQVAVQVDGGDARSGQLRGEPLGGVLGSHEEQGAVAA